MNSEIKTRTTAGNIRYYAFIRLLISSVVSRRKTLAIYWTVIDPIVMCGSEAKAMKTP